MDWLDKRMAEFKAQDEARKKISECAEGIYENLWAAIKAVVREASEKGIDLKANGFPLHHVVEMGARKLNLDLSLDERIIVANDHERPQIVFTLAVSEDGSVCLRRENFTFNYAQAAARIMDQFLFEGKSPYAVDGK